MIAGNIPIQSNGSWRNHRFDMVVPLAVVMLLLHPASGFAVTGPRNAMHSKQGMPVYSMTSKHQTITTHHLTLSSTALMMSRVDDLDVVSNVAQLVKVWTLDDKQVSLDEILRQEGPSPVILSCLSHFGDFNAWELTQQYTAALKPGGKLRKFNSRIVLVGIGSVGSAQKFAKDLDLDSLSDRLTLVTDPEGSVTDALGCYKGWLTADTEHRKRYPQADISPYLKLLGMIFGFGSPGTITNVLYGYLGDPSGRKGVDGRTWVVDGLLQGSSKGRFPTLTREAFKDTPATSSLRPFELATLRLQTGLHIVLNWGSLGPKNSEDLFTRMGATFVLDSALKCLWNYFDQGILTYADLDEICKVVEDASVSNGSVWSTTKQEVAWSQGPELVDPPAIEVTTDPDPPIMQDKELIPGDEAKLPVLDEIQGSDEAVLKNVEEIWEEEASLLSQASEESISLGPVPEEDLGLEDLEEAILEELQEEAIVELEAAMEEDSDEDGIQVDFLALAQANHDIENEATVQSRERFLRSLLEARLQYEKSARTLPEPSRLRTLSSLPKKVPATSLYTDEATVDSTNVSSTPNKEIFQRNLLKAQYKYKSFQPTNKKSSDSNSFSHFTNHRENGAPNQSAPVPETQKELFQRALLQARLQNECV